MPESALDFARSLRITAHYLHSVCVNVGRVIELEVDILDNESPDFVAESVRIEMSL